MYSKKINQLATNLNPQNTDLIPIGDPTTGQLKTITYNQLVQSAGVPTSRTLTINGTTYDLSANRTWTVGTVTSVGLSMPSAFTVSNTPVTGSGTLTVTAAGTASQYVRGDGQLADFPQGGGGGGASVNYYLNGSVSQGTFGGSTYYEMNKSPVIGSGTNFTINADGYIASFLTDANDPNLLLIPGGNWNFELKFSASSGGGTPSFYLELYKYDGSTFTLISSSSTSPEIITGGTSIDTYYTTTAVPETVLSATDRLAIRIYVTHQSKTITFYTEDNKLAQVITTFTTGLNALNGLTKQVQYFATGTSGTDFNISSSNDTHTFNFPTASATNRGLLSTTDWSTFNSKENVLTFSSPLSRSTNTISIPAATSSVNGYLTSTDWSTFNSKQDAITLTTTGTSGAATLVGSTLNIPNYGSSLSGYVPYTGATNDVDLGSRKLTSFRVTIDELTSGGNLRFKQYSQTTSGESGYTTISALSQNYLNFNFSQLSGFEKSFTFDTSSLSTGVTRYLTIPNASGTLALTSDIPASLTLTTTGTSGAATLVGSTLNIPQYQAALTNPVTGTGTTNEIAYWTSSSAIGSLTTATYPSLTELSYVKGVTSSIQTQLNGKQGTLTLTTTGTSGAATLVGDTLNIPQYSGGGSMAIGGTVTSGTTGSILFIDPTATLAQDNANLFWDNTNNRLGIGTASPSGGLHLNYDTSTSSDAFLLTRSTVTYANAHLRIINGTGNAGEFVPYFIASSNFLSGGTSPVANYTIGLGFIGAITNSTTDDRGIVFNARTKTPSALTQGWIVNFSNYTTDYMRISYQGNMVLQNGGTFTDAGYRLDVNGTGRFSDNLLVSKNQNNSTGITISNTTSGTISQAAVTVTSDSSSGSASFAKYSSTRTAYKILNSNDAYLYNGTTAGDLSILNDFTTGKIKFAAGGSSTAQVTIGTTGLTTFATGVDYKRLNPTTTTTASTATLTPDISAGDQFTITAQAAALSVANPTGTPVNGQKMMIRIKDNGTARAITWSGTQYRASSDLALPTTTVINKTMYLGFIWNSTDSKWDLLALLNNF